jgi:hypothetical protein
MDQHIELLITQTASNITGYVVLLGKVQLTQVWRGNFVLKE